MKFSPIVSQELEAPDRRLRREKSWCGIIVHHTANWASDESKWAGIGKAVAKWLTTKDENYVSAHFQIDRDGAITQLCDPRFYEAFHAGKSEHWCVINRRVQSDWNRWAVGIELLGDGNKGPYSSAQYTALVALTTELLKAFPEMHPKNILGHEEISPGRKTDPGVYFDWENYMSQVYEKIRV